MRHWKMITILSVIFVLVIVLLSVLLYFLMKRRPPNTSQPSTPSTVPPAPPGPVSDTYHCDAATNKCSVDTTGKGQYSDITTCEDACTPPPGPVSDTYHCDAATNKCSVDPTGKGQYSDITTCEDACTPPPGPAPGPAPDFYPGNGEASTTYFTSGESKGAGACGGCVYPGIKNMPVDYDFQASNFDNLYEQMKNIVTDGAHWTMAAASEAMMAPYCPGSVGMGCTGRTNPQGTTAVAPCGTCWRLTRKGNNKKVNVVVADACPCGNTSVCPTTAGGADNSKWCLAEPGVSNSVGMYNHFDVWNATDPVLDWPSNGQDGDPVTFENIECPDSISNLMAESCCGTYYDGSQGGSPQGCPNICGPQYTCPS